MLDLATAEVCGFNCAPRYRSRFLFPCSPLARGRQPARVVHLSPPQRTLITRALHTPPHVNPELTDRQQGEKFNCATFSDVPIAICLYVCTDDCTVRIVRLDFGLLNFNTCHDYLHFNILISKKSVN